MRLLEQLLDVLFPPRTDELVVRALTSLPVSYRSISLKGSLGAIKIRSLLRYHDSEVRALIHEAKYAGNKKAQKILGNILFNYIFSLTPYIGSTRVVLIPVPLGKSRRKKRGYNQVERIARYTLKKLRKRGNYCLNTQILMRIRDTEPQTSLGSAARSQNIKGAFEIRPGSLPLDPQATYILLDDVLTTGATLSAAHAALNAAGAGAGSVLVVALAR